MTVLWVSPEAGLSSPPGSARACLTPAPGSLLLWVGEGLFEVHMGSARVLLMIMTIIGGVLTMSQVEPLPGVHFPVAFHS